MDWRDRGGFAKCAKPGRCLLPCPWIGAIDASFTLNTLNQEGVTLIAFTDSDDERIYLRPLIFRRQGTDDEVQKRRSVLSRFQRHHECWSALGVHCIESRP